MCICGLKSDGWSSEPEVSPMTPAASRIEKMVVDERYCIDVLTQIAAVSTALEAVALEILDDHVTHCVAGALASGDEADARVKTDELLAAVRRFARTR